jgi:hypothetical protein
MIKKRSMPPTILALLLIILGVAVWLGAGDRHTLVLNGQSTDVLVIYMGGHPYVDLQALANALNGSVSSSGTIVALSLPLSSASHAPSPTTSSAAPSPLATESAPSRPGFSREFLNAGIEEMSTLREWHTVLQTAIQTGIPLSEGLLQPYRAQATTKLRLAFVAAITTADRSAYQLLNNAFVSMGKLSDKYLKMRASLTYIAPDALENDGLNKRIIDCSHSLAAMAASGQFGDDGSCN